MKHSLKSLALLAGVSLILASLTACGDGYPSVKIGEQTWMSKNLDLIPKIGVSWCYDDDPANCEKYGRLYDYEAAKNICPEGWHLPSNGEWKAMASFIANGNDSLVSVKLKTKTGWNDYEWRDYASERLETKPGNGIDEYGFSALPNGYRWGKFSSMGEEGYFWTSNGSVNIDNYHRFNIKNGEDVDNGLGVRCVKND
jgi:uncharacterized protein (TIGR02145 family)